MVLLTGLTFGQKKASLSSLFYERTDYLPKGISLAVGPNITYSTRWNREDELFGTAPGGTEKTSCLFQLM